jgi:hypothetical protein
LLFRPAVVAVAARGQPHAALLELLPLLLLLAEAAAGAATLLSSLLLLCSPCSVSIGNLGLLWWRGPAQPWSKEQCLTRVVQAKMVCPASILLTDR